MTTIKTRDRHWVKIDALFSFTVCLAPVITVTPDTTQAAVRALRWPVGLRMMLQMIKMLIQGIDCWQNTAHRLVSFLVVIGLRIPQYQRMTSLSCAVPVSGSIRKCF